MRMELDIGELNKKISILSIQDEEDIELNQMMPKEKELRRPWARVRQTGGTEVTENLKVNSETYKEFTIRFVKGITKDMKIRYKEEMYDIISIEDVEEKGQFLIIKATNVEEKSDVNEYGI